MHPVVILFGAWTFVVIIPVIKFVTKHFQIFSIIML